METLEAFETCAKSYIDLLKRRDMDEKRFIDIVSDNYNL